MSDVINVELIRIDFPKPQEKIVSSTYMIRLRALSDAELVEVSIDECQWQPCRPAGGFWWFNWADYQSGLHELVCRAYGINGDVFTSEPTTLRVELAQAAQGRRRPRKVP